MLTLSLKSLLSISFLCVIMRYRVDFFDFDNITEYPVII